MNKTLFTLLALFIGSMAAHAQTSKAEQLKYIRQTYAKAKEQMAANGKDGNPRRDMTVSLTDGDEIDADFSLIDETELTCYFDKVRRYRDDNFFEDDQCYFITENWSCHGHTRYREFLFDPKEGHLLFIYSHYETDAGTPFDSRFYYDAKGNVIEQLHKVRNKPASGVELEDMQSEQGEKALAEKYLSVFNGVMAPAKEWEDGPVRKTTPKDDRMSFIRSTYAQAKQKVDKDDKAEVKRNMTIVVHDQEEGDCPPSTKEIKYYFERQQDGEKSVNHCYFITTRFKTMSFDDYSEYLFEPKRPELIFGYDCAREEGEKYEYRYYFDENQRCIERKEAMTEEGYDNSFDVKMTARNSLKVFNLLAN